MPLNGENSAKELKKSHGEVASDLNICLHSFINQAIEIWSLVAPIAMTKLGLPLRGFFLSWIFSQLGTSTLAAGALSFSLFFVIVSFFVGATQTGVGVFASRAISRNDTLAATKIFQHGIYLGLLLSIPGMFIFYFSPYLFQMLGQQVAIINIIRPFMHFLTWMLIPFIIIINSYKLFNTIKQSRVSMYYSICGILFTCITSYILALGMLGLPRLGVAGVGLGMLISYWLQMLVMVAHIRKSILLRGYSIFSKFNGIDISLLRDILFLGLPVAFRNNIEYLLFFIIASLLGSSEHEALPVYQIILQYFLLSSQLAYSMWVGSIILIGEAIGKKRLDLIRSISLTSLFLMIIILLLIGGGFWVCKNEIIGLFFSIGGQHYNLLNTSFAFVIIIPLLDGIRKVITSFLVALKDTVFSLTAEITSLWLVALPFGYYLGLNLHNRLEGFMIGLIIGFIVNNCLLIIHSRQIWTACHKRC